MSLFRPRRLRAEFILTMFLLEVLPSFESNCKPVVLHFGGRADNEPEQSGPTQQDRY